MALTQFAQSAARDQGENVLLKNEHACLTMQAKQSLSTLSYWGITIILGVFGFHFSLLPPDRDRDIDFSFSFLLLIRYLLPEVHFTQAASDNNEWLGNFSVFNLVRYKPVWDLYCNDMNDKLGRYSSGPSERKSATRLSCSQDLEMTIYWGAAQTLLSSLTTWSIDIDKWSSVVRVCLFKFLH